jgi:hypothetical protein
MKKTILSLLFVLSFSFASSASPLDEAKELFKINEYDKTIVVLEKFVKDNPQSADAYFLLSKCYEAKGDFSKSFSASGMYEKLKYTNFNKDKVEKKVIVESKDDDNSSVNQEEKNSSDPVAIDLDYLNLIISKRDAAKEDANKKFYDVKKITSLLEKIPSSTDELSEFKKKLDFKSKYALITNEELISSARADLSILQINIDIAKYDLSQLKEDTKIKEKNDLIKSLFDKYSLSLQEFEKLVNTPVYPNTDQTSFDYYKYSNNPQETHIKALEELKKNLFAAIEAENKELNDLKVSIFKDQESILNMKSITPEKLAAKPETLAEIDKKNVDTYNQLTNTIKENKERLLEIVSEQEILYTAFNNSNATILQINPTYKLTDKPLPSQPKLQELKEDDSKNKEVK